MFAFSKLKAKVSRLSAMAVVTVLTSPVAMAQGFITGIMNMTNLFRVATIALIAGGVLVGLGVIAWGVMDMVKKGGQRGDDISWLHIGLKFIGGAFLLALSWVGTTTLETVGGNAGSIGRNIN